MVFSLLFVLLAVTGLVFVLLSTHLRQALSRFAERNFFPHRYDYRTRWMEVTEALGGPGTPEQIARRAVQLLKGIFGARSIAIWMATGLEEGTWTRIGAYNTAGTTDRIKETHTIKAWLEAQNGPRDVSLEGEMLPPALQAAIQRTDAVLIIPLKAGHHAIGWVTLAAHARGSSYGQQDQDLLRCIAAQLADRLQHLVLANRLIMAREMEAFYEYSTFFLHDLKNFTATLSLVTQNAERHGGNPEFQQAAMRSVGATVRKMNAMMGTVAALSRDLHPKLVPVELNELVEEVLKGFNDAAGVELRLDLHPVPQVEVDSDQLQQVLLNLVLNAQEAVGAGGRITVRTEAETQGARLVVEDDGCGMDHATIAGLFRPFRTTKGRGLGIGLYQCQKIIHAHRGVLEVESEVGKGSRFVIRLSSSR
jgi:putative PEP-CTERM system histidine kinase